MAHFRRSIGPVTAWLRFSGAPQGVLLLPLAARATIPDVRKTVRGSLQRYLGVIYGGD